MSKRRVPAALHHELSEYASLLRALRTRDTMDITKHLTKPSPFALTTNEADEASSSDMPPAASDSGLFDEGILPTTTAEGSSSRADTPSSLSRNTVDKGKAKASIDYKRTQRDQWTRWPLLLDDVPKPEWTLEDEVAVIASQTLKNRSSAVPSVSLDEADDEEDDGTDEEYISLDMEVEEDDPDHPFYVALLTYTTVKFLSAILGELASFVPPRAASLQNRWEPMNWRVVMDAVVSCGDPEFSDPQALENVSRRMEKLYGSSTAIRDGPLAADNKPTFRSQLVRNSKEKVKDALAQIDNLIFTQASAPESTASLIVEESPRPKKKRRIARSTLREERDFVARKKWVPKDKRAPNSATAAPIEQSLREPTTSQCAGPSTSTRRSTRIKGKMDYHEAEPS